MPFERRHRRAPTLDGLADMLRRAGWDVRPGDDLWPLFAVHEHADALLNILHAEERIGGDVYIFTVRYRSGARPWLEMVEDYYGGSHPAVARLMAAVTAEMRARPELFAPPNERQGVLL